MVKGTSRTLNKKLIPSVTTSHTKISRPVQPFSLQATSDFASRSSDIFGNLSVLENRHETWISDNETLEPVENKFDAEPIQKETEVFKKPFAPRSTKKTPFSNRNMKKWIKYSLEDVPLSSDATNKAVAFQFLRDLKKQKEAAVDKDSSDEKIKFCQPIKGKRCTKGESSGGDTAHFKADKSEINMEKNETNIKLGHLDEELDED